MGVLYDFKQTPDRKSTTVDRHNYSEIIEEFLLKNWDERVLNRYYRVARPLYTTQIFIPTISAYSAPLAFEVEKDCFNLPFSLHVYFVVRFRPCLCMSSLKILSDHYERHEEDLQHVGYEEPQNKGREGIESQGERPKGIPAQPTKRPYEYSDEETH